MRAVCEEEFESETFKLQNDKKQKVRSTLEVLLSFLLYRQTFLKLDIRQHQKQNAADKEARGSCQNEVDIASSDQDLPESLQHRIGREEPEPVRIEARNIVGKGRKHQGYHQCVQRAEGPGDGLEKA